MNPEQYFIDSHRRLLGDLSSESLVYHQYLTFYLEIITVVLITCLLLITTLYHCFLSRSNRFPNNLQNHDHGATTPRQANHQELQAIPVLTYGAISLPPSSMSSECAICLDEYLQEDSVRVLRSCNHVFHKDCIDQWLRTRSVNCPICRNSMIETCHGNGAAVGNNAFPVVSTTFTDNAGRYSNL